VGGGLPPMPVSWELSEKDGWPNILAKSKLSPPPNPPKSKLSPQPNPPNVGVSAGSVCCKRPESGENSKGLFPETGALSPDVSLG
jgi:hypothetical protein